MKDQKIANNTAIRLKALPRCNMKRSCKECLALTVTENDKEVPVNKLMNIIFFNFTQGNSVNTDSICETMERSNP